MTTFTPNPYLVSIRDASMRLSSEYDMSILFKDSDNDGRRKNYIIGILGTSVLLILLLIMIGVFIQLMKTDRGKLALEKLNKSCTRRIYGDRNMHGHHNSRSSFMDESSMTFTIIRNEEYTVCGNRDDNAHFNALLSRMRFFRVIYLLVAFGLLVTTTMLIMNIGSLDFLVKTTKVQIDKLNKPVAILNDINDQMKQDFKESMTRSDEIYSILRNEEINSCFNNIVLKNSAGAMEIQLRDLNLNNNEGEMTSFVDDLRSGEGVATSVYNDITKVYNGFYWSAVACVLILNSLTVLLMYCSVKAWVYESNDLSKFISIVNYFSLSIFIVFTGLLWCFTCFMHASTVINSDFCVNNQDIANTIAPDENVLRILRIQQFPDDTRVFKIVQNIMDGCPEEDGDYPHAFMKLFRDKLSIAIAANNVLYETVQSSKVNCPEQFSTISDKVVQLNEVLSNLVHRYTNAINEYLCSDLYEHYIELSHKNTCNTLPMVLIYNFINLFSIGICCIILVSMRFCQETDIEIFIRDSATRAKNERQQGTPPSSIIGGESLSGSDSENENSNAQYSGKDVNRGRSLIDASVSSDDQSTDDEQVTKSLSYPDSTLQTTEGEITIDDCLPPYSTSKWGEEEI